MRRLSAMCRGIPLSSKAKRLRLRRRRPRCRSAGPDRTAYVERMTTFDALAVARDLEAAGIERRQAEATADACQRAAGAGAPVTRPEPEAALETRMTWRLLGGMAAMIGLGVAIIKLLP